MDESTTQSLLWKAILLALFLVPIVYIGEILAVAIHEIAGHGLAAVALGGTFDGFVLKWDGMGWAHSYLPPDASAMDRIFHLAAGVAATTSAGTALLIVAYVVRRRVGTRLCVLLLSGACLMEGISYTLWNSYHPVPPGDIGKIMIWWHVAGLPHASMMRIVLLVVSGIMFLTATFVLCALVFQGIEQALLAGDRLAPHARFWILLLFLVTPGGAAWFLFDWNQLAPGIGWLPCIAGAASMVVSATVLYWFSLTPSSEVPGMTPTWYHLLVSWGSLVVTIALMFSWFQNGVSWG
ncbi:MAG: M50 family metallopeptidase [Planctomycetota bacterium]|jgi:hypothetical protein